MFTRWLHDKVMGEMSDAMGQPLISIDIYMIAIDVYHRCATND